MVNKTKNKKGRRSPALVAGLVLLFLAIIIIITLAMFASFDEVTNVFEAGKVDIVLVEDKWDPTNGDNTVPNTFIDKNPAIYNKDDTVETSVFLKVIVPYEDDPNFIIEYADQDDSDANNRKGGSVFYQNDSEKKAKVPYYKFVVTGEKAKQNTEDDDSEEPTESGAVVFDRSVSFKQEINEGWLLIAKADSDADYSSIDEENKTVTYIYAHVHQLENGEYELAPLLPDKTTVYPLFNQIYLLNFRERDLYKKDEFGNYETDEDGKKISTGSESVFPDPTRNYNIRIEAYGIQTNFLKENNTTTLDPNDVWKNYINKEYGS